MDVKQTYVHVIARCQSLTSTHYSVLSVQLDKKFRSFGFDDNDDFEKKFRSFGKDDDFDKKFRSFGLRDDASDVSPATVTPDQPIDEFVKDVIHWHNTYRAKHQVFIF